jgi:hypothetical protein
MVTRKMPQDQAFRIPNPKVGINSRESERMLPPGVWHFGGARVILESLQKPSAGNVRALERRRQGRSPHAGASAARGEYLAIAMYCGILYSTSTRYK